MFFRAYTEEDDGDGTACPICYEPWEESGDHRLVSLKCGHLFGESCLNMWFNQQNQVKNRMFCPVCRTKAMPHHIRPIFARRVVQIKYEKINELRTDLAKWKRRCQQLEQQYHRLHHQAQAAASVPLPIQTHSLPPTQISHQAPQVPGPTTTYLHALHSTTAQATPITSAMERPRILTLTPDSVFPPVDYRNRMLRHFLPQPTQVYATPPPFAMENEYTI